MTVEERRRRRQAWLSGAREVISTGQVTVLCPENLDAPLNAVWLPSHTESDGRGEYRRPVRSERARDVSNGLWWSRRSSPKSPD